MSRKALTAFLCLTVALALLPATAPLKSAYAEQATQVSLSVGRGPGGGSTPAQEGDDYATPQAAVNACSEANTDYTITLYKSYVFANAQRWNACMDAAGGGQAEYAADSSAAAGLSIEALADHSSITFTSAEPSQPCYLSGGTLYYDPDSDDDGDSCAATSTPDDGVGCINNQVVLSGVRVATIDNQGLSSAADTKVVFKDVVLRGGYASSEGGGISLSDQVALALDHVTMRDCVVDNDSAAHCGGALAVSSSGDVQAEQARFENNCATPASDSAPGQGGAVYLAAGSQAAIFSLQNSYFEGNLADAGGALYLANCGDLGALAQSKVQIDQSHLLGNQAERGGAVCCEAASGSAVVLRVYGSVFEENVATEDGGAIWLDQVDRAQLFLGSPLDVGLVPPSGDYAENDFAANRAGGDGGAIYSSDPRIANLTADQCGLFFAQNEASRAGDDLRDFAAPSGFQARISGTTLHLESFPYADPSVSGLSDLRSRLVFTGFDVNAPSGAEPCYTTSFQINDPDDTVLRYETAGESVIVIPAGQAVPAAVDPLSPTILNQYLDGRYISAWRGQDGRRYDFAAGQTALMPDHAAVFQGIWSNLAVARYAITFDACGGKPVAACQRDQGDALGALPQASRTGYRFLGWYSKAKGGSRASAAAQVTRDIRLYAHWQAKRIKVKFVLQPGKQAKSRSYLAGKKLGKLPKATRAHHYTLRGWYSKAKGGKKLSKATKLYAPTTVYAHWRKLKRYVKASQSLYVRTHPAAHAVSRGVVGVLHAGSKARVVNVVYLRGHKKWYRIRYHGEVCYLVGRGCKVVWK
ncbi:MAG: InlB B-repeat-containing protein [Coriobacteriales bacterium]|nr:InlB B-repeat-containing protein [Coriobacteriales bacterium]